MTTPSAYDPQKALLVAEPPRGPRWVHELRLDGFRMGVFIAREGRNRSVRIISRKGTDYTAAYPEVCSSALALPCQTVALDGEVVVLNERGLSDFQALQNRARVAAGSRISRSICSRSTVRT